jgi:hypothetical protein
MQERCLICKYMDKNQSEEISSSTFFKRDRRHSIYLCYIHSIEYFKVGQSRFFSNHERTFKQLCAPEDHWVLDYLHEMESRHN